MNDYLIETQSIDYNDENIQKKVGHLKELSSDDIDYIERCFMFVRDEFHIHGILMQVLSQKKLVKYLQIKQGCAGQNHVFLQLF